METNQNSQSQPMERERTGSKVLGILSIIFGILIPIAGVILAIIGLNIKKSQTNPQRDKNLNYWGLAVSIVMWVINVVIIANA